MSWVDSDIDVIDCHRQGVLRSNDSYYAEGLQGGTTAVTRIDGNPIEDHRDGCIVLGDRAGYLERLSDEIAR